MFNFIKNFKENNELIQRNNTLENENQVLKNKVVKMVADKFDETETTKKLRTDNKRLRAKNKELKALLNEKGIKR